MFNKEEDIPLDEKSVDDYAIKTIETVDSSSATKGELSDINPINRQLFLLIKFLSSQFVSNGITLRQVMMWAYYVKKYTKEIDWPQFLALLDEYRLRDFYNSLNAISVENLGFPIDIFPLVQFVLEKKREC